MISSGVESRIVFFKFDLFFLFNLLDALLNYHVDFCVHLLQTIIDQDEADCHQEKHTVRLQSIVSVLEFTSCRHYLYNREEVENNEKARYRYKSIEKSPERNLLRAD